MIGIEIVDVTHRPPKEVSISLIGIGAVFSGRLGEEGPIQGPLLRTYDGVVSLHNPSQTWSTPQRVWNYVELEGELRVWPKGQKP